MTRRPADWRIGLAAMVCVLVTIGSGATATAATGRSNDGRSRTARALIGRTVKGAGDAISGRRFEELARAAGSDPVALELLRRVRRVDGRPVDVSLALTGERAAVQQRLAILAGLAGRRRTSPGNPGAGDVARRDAARVLAGDKYRPRQIPRPLRGALGWLGDRLDPVLGPVVGLVSRLAESVAGLLAMVVGLIVVTAVAAQRMIAGRSRAAVVRRDRSPLGDLGADPRELDRRAAEAEAGGDHRGAVRLRYQAGLLRLDQAGRIVLRPDTTAGAAAAQVGSPVLDRLTTDFEEIVYGGRTVGPADGESARAGWAAVLGAGVRR